MVTDADKFCKRLERKADFIVGDDDEDTVSSDTALKDDKRTIYKYIPEDVCLHLELLSYGLFTFAAIR